MATTSLRPLESNVLEQASVKAGAESLAALAAWLAPEVAALLQRLPADWVRAIEEIRLRAGRPIEIVGAGRSTFLDAAGHPIANAAAAWCLDPAILERTWQIVCEASVYSRIEETRQGFITLPGGYRVGVSGRILVEDGRLLRVRDVGSLNFRVARQIYGCATPALRAVWDATSDLPHSSLIVSPPGAGKTTLLRDLIRQLSAGAPGSGRRGLRVALIDERAEVAACHRGIPRLDVGPRTDVLSECPKVPGIEMAVRSLSPQVVAFDELGGAADARAVLEAAHCGVRVIATAHARNVDELRRRPSLARLWSAGVFQCVVVLKRDGRPGLIRYAGPLARCGMGSDR